MANILLVEDQPVTARIIETMLAIAGHAVTWRENGVEAIAAFKASTPDIVITDIVMPEMDGIELIHTLRKMAYAVPIIAVSGGGPGSDFSSLEIARHVGADDAIRKPPSNEQLLSAVERCLVMIDSARR